MTELDFFDENWPFVFCLLCLVGQFTRGILNDEQVKYFVDQILQILKACENNSDISRYDYSYFVAFSRKIDSEDGLDSGFQRYISMLRATNSISAMQRVVQAVNQTVLPEDGDDVKAKLELMEQLSSDEGRSYAENTRFLESGSLLGKFVQNATEYFLRLELHQRSTLFRQFVEFANYEQIYDKPTEQLLKSINMGIDLLTSNPKRNLQDEFAKHLEGGDIGRLLELVDKISVQNSEINHASQHMLLSLVYNVLGSPDAAFDHAQEALNICMLMRLDDINLELTLSMIMLIRSYPAVETRSKLGDYHELWRHACSVAAKCPDEQAKYLQLVYSIRYGLESREHPVKVLEKAALATLRFPLMQHESSALSGRGNATLAKMWWHYGRGKMARKVSDDSLVMIDKQLRNASGQSLIAYADDLGRVVLERAMMFDADSSFFAKLEECQQQISKNAVALQIWERHTLLIYAHNFIQNGDADRSQDQLDLVQQCGKLGFDQQHILNMLRLKILLFQRHYTLAYEEAGRYLQELGDEPRFGEDHMCYYRIVQLQVGIESLRRPECEGIDDLFTEVAKVKEHAQKLYHVPLFHTANLLQAQLMEIRGDLEGATGLLEGIGSKILMSGYNENIHSHAMRLAACSLREPACIKRLTSARDWLETRLKVASSEEASEEDAGLRKRQAELMLGEVRACIERENTAKKTRTPQRKDSKRQLSPNDLPSKKMRTPV